MVAGKKERDVEMEDTTEGKDTAKEDKKKEKEVPETPAEKLLKRLIACVYNDFSAGVQGDNAKMKQAVEEFFFFRAQIQELENGAGYAVLSGLLKLFTQQIQPDKLVFKAETEYPSSQTSLGDIRLSVESLLNSISQQKTFPPSSTQLEVAAFLVLISAVVVADQTDTLGDMSVKLAYDYLTNLWQRCKFFNRRSSDFIAAKVCFYRALFHGKLKLSNEELRAELLDDYRTCVLNHNEPCQAVITNLLLQKYIEDTLITQAARFSSKATMPERADPYQIARYSYYCGRVAVIQLQYGDALNHFRQALRKAPQDGAIGFKQIVTKYFVVTLLLMGEIPEKSVFRQEGMVSSLRPYFQLTQAVRVGDMKLFQNTMTEFSSTFETDGVYMLITRLSHNVIKAALRKISVSYSRIHLKDVASKLQLGSSLEAEYIVAKAIRDGVIDAVIEHRQQIMRSTEVSSVYQTSEPQMQLDRRIRYCLDLYQNSVKSKRYTEEKVTEETKEADEDGETIEQIVTEFLDNREKEEED